jgi:hypothetical protein
MMIVSSQIGIVLIWPCTVFSHTAMQFPESHLMGFDLVVADERKRKMEKCQEKEREQK